MKNIWFAFFLNSINAQTCVDIRQHYQTTCCSSTDDTHLDITKLIPLKVTDYFKWFPPSMEVFYRASSEFLEKVSSVLSIDVKPPTGFDLDVNTITISPPYYHSSIPTLAALTSYEGVGLRSTEYLNWYYEEKGHELVDLVLDDLNLVGFIVGGSLPQDYFYTMKPLKSIHDLDGMAMRGVGVFGGWLRSVGAVRNDSTAELYEYVTPAIDSTQDWYSKFKYSYKISKEPRGNYFMLFPKAIWALFPTDIQNSLREWGKTSTYDMLKYLTEYENAYTGYMPQELTLPTDIEKSWITYIHEKVESDMNASWATTNFKNMINSMKLYKNSL